APVVARERRGARPAPRGLAAPAAPLRPRLRPFVLGAREPGERGVRLRFSRAWAADPRPGNPLGRSCRERQWLDKTRNSVYIHSQSSKSSLAWVECRAEGEPCAAEPFGHNLGRELRNGEFFLFESVVTH